VAAFYNEVNREVRCLSIWGSLSPWERGRVRAVRKNRGE